VRQPDSRETTIYYNLYVYVVEEKSVVDGASAPECQKRYAKGNRRIAGNSCSRCSHALSGTTASAKRQEIGWTLAMDGEHVWCTTMAHRCTGSLRFREWRRKETEHCFELSSSFRPTENVRLVGKAYSCSSIPDQLRNASAERAGSPCAWRRKGCGPVRSCAEADRRKQSMREASCEQPSIRRSQGRGEILLTDSFSHRSRGKKRVRLRPYPRISRTLGFFFFYLPSLLLHLFPLLSPEHESSCIYFELAVPRPCVPNPSVPALSKERRGEEKKRALRHMILYVCR